MMTGQHCPYLVTEFETVTFLTFGYVLCVFVLFCLLTTVMRRIYSRHISYKLGSILYCRKVYIPGRHKLAPVFLSGKMSLVRWPCFLVGRKHRSGNWYCGVFALCQPHTENLVGLSNLNDPAAFAVSSAFSRCRISSWDAGGSVPCPASCRDSVCVSTRSFGCSTRRELLRILNLSLRWILKF